MRKPVVCLFDANVLYPAPVRDLLLWLCEGRQLVRGHWTDTINDEWVRNLHANRPDLSPERLATLVEVMNGSFPDARVTGYERHMPYLELPDQNDRHVLAAAIEIKAQILVTENLKDFPDSILSRYEIEALRADDFFVRMYNVDPLPFLDAVKLQRTNLRKPPVPASEHIQTFRKNGLAKLAAILEGHMGSI